MLGVLLPDDTIDSISPNQQIIVYKLRYISDSRLKLHCDVMTPAVLLKDTQQREPGDAGISAAINAHLFALMHNRLVIPRLQLCLNLSVRFRITVFEKRQRGSREDHA